jgi:hypothetical protein
VRIGKHLSDNFPIQNGLKQGDALSPLFFNFALHYAIRNIQENQVAVKLNGKHQKLLIDASKDVGLEVNTEKIKCMLLSRHQNAGQNHDIKLGNRYFEIVAQFRYLGMTITNQNQIHEGIKRRLDRYSSLAD